MIRGHLRMLVIKALDEGEKSGYGLTKFISKNTGWKPSCGSMYPLLEQLTKEKIVEFKVKENKKMYALTIIGKEELKKISEKKAELLTKVDEVMKTYMTIYKQKLGKFQQKAINLMKEGKIDIENPPPEMTRLKELMSELVVTGKVKKEWEKINKLLKRTNDELEKIK
ncbi:MAG: PadR family transcriptional regulator [Nanoarchaeota archaeon]|nr:PadR family transcriptional regulator [Nanoarchaeota archaeon]MBU1030363.1 PadR family transcriptional regulator [Nanoarchaeota archaeon]